MVRDVWACMGTSVPSGVSRVNECRLTFDAGVHMLGTATWRGSFPLFSAATVEPYFAPPY